MASKDPAPTSPKGFPLSGLQVNRTSGSQRLEMKEALEIAGKKAHLEGRKVEARTFPSQGGLKTPLNCAKCTPCAPPGEHLSLMRGVGE